MRRTTTLFTLPSLTRFCFAQRQRQRQQFSTTNNPPLLKQKQTQLPPRPKPPPEDEIEESFLKGSGPGGQKINKTNSAVQLKHIPTGIVVKSQATRSRSQNRTIARQLLADKLDDMARGSESRASVVGEVKRKKRASSAKKSRRKYRKLEDEKAATAGEGLDKDEDIENDDGHEYLESEEGTDSERSNPQKQSIKGDEVTEAFQLLNCITTNNFTLRTPDKQKLEDI
ncbi:RF-1 domain-containing protein [Poronia punctata]|nr:RF-1 domain-containing protein [Poronia punctata]